MGDLWTKKYSPENSKSVLGQEKGLSELKSYISGYKHGGDAALVYGPTGCGKTAAVQAIAKELNLELVELNASDLRNKDAINSIVGSASKQMSLFMRGKIILVDVIDGLAGREDRGGLLLILGLSRYCQDASTRAVRAWMLPALVILPLWVEPPLECSEGTRPR